PRSRERREMAAEKARVRPDAAEDVIGQEDRTRLAAQLLDELSGRAERTVRADERHPPPRLHWRRIGTPRVLCNSVLAGASVQGVPPPRVVLAPNPGVMTGPGTNQYLVGDGAPVLIDVAPYDAENRRRLDAGLAGAALGGILLTHIHPDHVGGA